MKTPFCVCVCAFLAYILLPYYNKNTLVYFCEVGLKKWTSLGDRPRELMFLERSWNVALSLRLNDSPVRGYEDDVGNKTTMRLFYPESASYNPGLHNDPGTLMVLVPFKQQDLRWLKEILYNEKRVQDTYIHTHTHTNAPLSSSPFLHHTNAHTPFSSFSSPCQASIAGTNS